MCEEKAPVTKLISAAAFHLKGSGWYVTDFRDKGRKDGDKDKKEDAGSGAGDKAATSDGDKDGAKGGDKDGAKGSDKDGAKSESPAKKGSGGNPSRRRRPTDDTPPRRPAPLRFPRGHSRRGLPKPACRSAPPSGIIRASCRAVSSVGRASDF